jgi:hypothetical protein
MSERYSRADFADFRESLPLWKTLHYEKHLPDGWPSTQGIRFLGA